MEHLGDPRDPFDYSVGGIEYVIDRPQDKTWRIGNFVNHRSHILAYAISGRAHYQINGVAHPVRSGGLIFMPKGAVHSAASDRDDPWHFMSVAFDLTSAGPDVMGPLEKLPSVTYQVPLELDGIFREMYAVWNLREPGHLVQIRGAVSTILYQVIREHSLPALRQPHARRITAITKMLRENYASTYSVEELALKCGLSPSHFRLMFKRVTGMTATRYQQHVKVTKATEFLTSGEYNVTETARQTGFRDVYYFSRLFSKLTGTNPSSLSKE